MLKLIAAITLLVSMTGCATAIATAGAVTSIGISTVGAVGSVAVSGAGAVVHAVTP